MGEVYMVQVGGKEETLRRAVARGAVVVSPATLELIERGALPKGDVLTVARVAGIMAAKLTPRLLPLCHPVRLTSVEVELKLDRQKSRVEIEARATAVDRTGVEMEALTAVAVAALTVYDMIKGVDRCAFITDIRLVAKSGGKSGDFVREGEEEVCTG
ncbi:molybdenum cofactor biosynthesis protein C [Ammonifex degensii KC4]|uniref:Molybdenum cofactor biosynthesis protein C n=1 Tax=Ammonifex degensii (strain DSM 10501 / KC4) TaxID=429009 RepID=C9RCT0_AMMDK|nr:molybdenum cofactor biosynthesis protein C [Ammonifex degensii KC4]